MAVDLAIEQSWRARSGGGCDQRCRFNIAAATCVGPGERAELHILVAHAEAVNP
jgi:hypothetical protein